MNGHTDKKYWSVGRGFKTLAGNRIKEQVALLTADSRKVTREHWRELY